MWNPKNFSKFNNTCVDTANVFLEKSGPHFVWQENEKILDIGCGDGKVTVNCLLPKLPKNFQEIIAIDKSPEMINFAKLTQKQPKVKFLEVEIPSPVLVQDFPGYFDHVFSFYCMHWVSNPRAAYRDIFNVLKPGGQALITMPIALQYDTLPILSKNPKWQPYMKDFDKEKTFTYQFLPDPVSALKDHLITENFKIIYCDLTDINVVSSKMEFEEFSNQVNPYVHQIPLEKRKEFIEDYIHCLKKSSDINYTMDKSNITKVLWKHRALAAFVYKS